MRNAESQRRHLAGASQVDANMIFEIDAHGGVPIYRQIMDQVRRQIVTGQMAEGEPLEQVRSLAARLKVNPMTVSKAYGYLEREGIVARRRGLGLFVAPVEKDARIRKKKEMLEGEIKRAAASAVHMGFSEEEASDLFQKHYRQCRSGKEGAES